MLFLLATTKTEDQVESRFFLDVVVGKGATVFELLAGEDQTLLVWRDAFLVLDLGLHVLDGVGRLNFQGDGLAGERLDEDLHTTTETEDQVKGRLLLDVVVRQGATILELFTSENETLLVWGNALLVLNLGLDVLNGVRGLDFERDRFTRQRLDEDLHTTAEAQHQVKCRLFLNVVIRQGTAIFELLAGEDKTLLVWWNTFLVLNLSVSIVYKDRNIPGSWL